MRAHGSGAARCIRTTYAGSRLPNSEFVHECDMVIKAIGQKKHNMHACESLPSSVLKTYKGYIAVDPDTNRTSHPKIFAGGDCIRSHGEASTVMAVQDGKIAAKSIYKQLSATKQNRQKPPAKRRKFTRIPAISSRLTIALQDSEEI